LRIPVELSEMIQDRFSGTFGVEVEQEAVDRIEKE
jgi:hypothetical protein